MATVTFLGRRQSNTGAGVASGGRILNNGLPDKWGVTSGMSENSYPLLKYISDRKTMKVLRHRTLRENN